MKQEDIDKKIGMPDVDAEWAKFERKVIDPKTASRKPLYWGIGIAASIALVAGIFIFGHDAEKPQQTITQQTAIEEPVESIASPKKDESTIIDTKQRPSTKSLLAETQKQAANEDLQGRIAGLTIVPTSADMEPNEMRLAGTRVAGRDTVRIGSATRPDSILAVIDGQPLMISLNNRQMTDNFNRYFYKRHQFVDKIMVYKDEDNKRPYIEKYGERAKNGVLVITTIPDTLCNAYVQQHPELMQIRHCVEGYVIDEETQEPLSDTWIHYYDTAGAVTDSTGHFILWLPRTDVELKFTHVGYVSCVVKTIKPMLTIRLKSATKLREVKVTPKQP